MKLNWGYKIAAMYLLFVAGIMYLVVMSSREKVDLVTADYYAQELKYQERIDEETRAAALSAPVSISLEGQTLVISFPQEFRDKNISGSVLVYCPSNKEMDITSTLSPADNTARISIPDKNNGMHEVQVSWQANGVTYYAEQNIFIQ